jgi:ketosteroid isomerase-like protein
MAEHPNAAAVRRLMTAFSNHDRATIEEVLDPACVWRVPGRNALGGEYAGRAAVLGLFGKIKRTITGPPQFDVVDIATSNDRAISYQYGVVVVGDRTVRMKECLIYRFEAGRVIEVDEFQYDQAAFDEAFSQEAVDTASSA